MISQTNHRIHFSSAQELSGIDSKSVDLIVTSPPYPMIEMWDKCFSSQDAEIAKALAEERGEHAFELMHGILDQVWRQCHRVLCEGGIACINIGDATRTVAGQFRLFPNHARIISSFVELGFSNLPDIIWRKQTNAPNKFMGSGMLPPGAYVTLEHEFILVFRKGNRREFSSGDKKNRRQSAYFWEERNRWFSDLWDLKGASQVLSGEGSRDRSAAYPFEIPFRLVNMFSVKGDVVLDPFAGTGTSLLAAIASGRDSIGYELEPELGRYIRTTLLSVSNLEMINSRIRERFMNHERFINRWREERGEAGLKHFNDWIEKPVMTRQETNMRLQFVESVREEDENSYTAFYVQESMKEYPESRSRGPGS